MPVRYPARSCTLLSRMSPCPTDTPFPYTTLFRSPTDNTVVSALEALLQVAESRSQPVIAADGASVDRKSTRLNSSHVAISYAVFCLKKKEGSPHWAAWACTSCGERVADPSTVRVR